MPATVLVEIEEAVATIRLNRPERRNAFTLMMLDELHQAFEVLEADDAVRVIVVTGTGPCFSAGTDLSAGARSLSSGDEPGATHPAEAGPRRPWIKPWTMRTPIIAALNGPAVGVGLTLPMTWDVRIAAADATYGFVFNRRGLIPEQGALWAVPRLVGVSRCIDLLLSGRHFTGQEAYERGLVTQVLPAEEVLPAALATAREIAAAHPVSVGLTKELLHRFQTEPDREAAYDQELQAFLWMTRQDDAAEGGRAYLEKRPPQWEASKKGPYPPVAGQEPALGNDSADHPPHR